MTTTTTTSGMSGSSSTAIERLGPPRSVPLVGDVLSREAVGVRARCEGVLAHRPDPVRHIRSKLEHRDAVEVVAPEEGVELRLEIRASPRLLSVDIDRVFDRQLSGHPGDEETVAELVAAGYDAAGWPDRLKG